MTDRHAEARERAVAAIRDSLNGAPLSQERAAWARDYLADADRELARLRAIENAAQDVAMTHHGQWRTRIQSGGNEHVPKEKLERLRAALAESAVLGSAGGPQ